MIADALSAATRRFADAGAGDDGEPKGTEQLLATEHPWFALSLKVEGCVLASVSRRRETSEGSRISSPANCP